MMTLSITNFPVLAIVDYSVGHHCINSRAYQSSEKCNFPDGIHFAVLLHI